MSVQTRLPPAMDIALITTVALVLYLATMAPGLTWAHYAADGGDLAIAIALGSVPHPTGYPTYLLLTMPLSWVTWGDVHTRLNFFSALSAAATVGTITWITTYVFASRWTGILAGTVLTTSTLFWSQALVAEVYALFAFAVAGLIAWGFYMHRNPRGRAHAVLSGLFVGLALGHHLLIVFLLPAVVVLMCSGWRGRQALWAGVGLLVGLSTYTILPLRAAHAMPLNWGGATDVHGFWWLVSGRLYRVYLTLPTRPEIFLRARQWAVLAVDQFGWWGFPFLVWGLLSPLSGRARTYRLLTIWGVSVYTIWAWMYRVTDWPVYTLPAWVLLAPWVAHGIQQVVPRRVALLGLLVPVIAGVVHGPQVDLHADREAITSVQAIWQVVPHRALVLVDGDRATFGLGYMHYAQGDRSDIRLISRTLWAFPWYREAIHRYYGDVLPTASLQDLIAQSDRPVYLVGDTIPGGVRFSPRGPYYTIVPIPISGKLNVGRLVSPPPSP